MESRLQISIIHELPRSRLRSQQTQTQAESVPSDSVIHHCIDAIIHAALKIHESPEGFSALCTLGHCLVQQEKAAGTRSNFRGDLREMNGWVTRFLNCLRTEFPPIQLKNLREEAYTMRHPWGIDMNLWRPQEAGVITLNQTIIHNMLQAHSNRNNDSITNDTYETFKFQMTVVMAHEIVHLFTGYFYSGVNFKTPPALAVPGYEESDVKEVFGELGRLWERKLFGGVIELYAQHKHPFREKQAGNVWLITPTSRSSRKGKQVDAQYIKDFSQGRFQLPIPESLLSRKEKAVGKLIAMSIYRQPQPSSALTRLGNIRVPTADLVDPNARYRRAPDVHRQHIQESNRSFWRRLV